MSVLFPDYDPAEACRLAQALARNCGYAVFPCGDDKKPACPHGFKDASKDPSEISRLWHRYRGELIGIATGTISGVSVLDIDPQHREAIEWWRSNHHRLLPTRTFKTRRGGLHLYFRHRSGVGNTQGKLAAGVDTRGDGGYAISWFACGHECVDQTLPAPWPDWLFAALYPPKPKPPPFVHATNPDNAIDGIVRKLAEAREGQRNGVLFWCACRLAERGMAQAVIEATLLPVAIGIGLTDFESRRTIASAMGRAAA
jgi:hypothetical protein